MIKWQKRNKQVGIYCIYFCISLLWLWSLWDDAATQLLQAAQQKNLAASVSQSLPHSSWCQTYTATSQNRTRQHHENLVFVKGMSTLTINKDTVYVSISCAWLWQVEDNTWWRNLELPWNSVDCLFETYDFFAWKQRALEDSWA